MKRRVVLAAALAGAVGALAGCKQEKTAAVSSTPDFFSHALPDTSGVSQPLSQWKGKPLLVNFWATWCAPCVKEMPDLDRLSRQFSGISFLGIGIDSAENIAQFLQKVPVGYTLLEARADGLDMMRDLGNASGGLPFTVIMSPDGKVLRAFAGQIDPEELARYLHSVPRA
nr:TlpA family protein disulfide reductase [Pseudomonas sp.]